MLASSREPHGGCNQQIRRNLPHNSSKNFPEKELIPCALPCSRGWALWRWRRRWPAVRPPRRPPPRRPAPTTAPTSAPTAAPTASPLPTTAPDPLPGPDAATSAAMAETLLARRGTATDLPLVGLVAEAEETDAGTRLLAYRVEDLLTPQPVPGETAALPVWQDTSWQPNGVPAIGLTEEEMRALADEAAAALGAGDSLV